ncbi:MAG: hypothetical protein QOG09_1708 [Solirubrobacterales bacterium]|jgi:hypothetical protein|nr:hypothetical protein [Solirubrobacterales bacterium]
MNRGTETSGSGCLIFAAMIGLAIVVAIMLSSTGELRFGSVLAAIAFALTALARARGRAWSEALGIGLGTVAVILSLLVTWTGSQVDH